MTDFNSENCRHLQQVIILRFSGRFSGWLGGAKMLSKLPVPERPTTLDYSRARAYCACSRCRWGLFGHFLSSITSLFFLPLWETARYRVKYCLKGPLSPKQPANWTFQQAVCCFLCVFLCPRRNFGWHIKIEPSVRLSVSPLQIVSQRYLINY